MTMNSFDSQQGLLSNWPDSLSSRAIYYIKSLFYLCNINWCVETKAIDKSILIFREEKRSRTNDQSTFIERLCTASLSLFHWRLRRSMAVEAWFLKRDEAERCCASVLILTGDVALQSTHFHTDGRRIGKSSEHHFCLSIDQCDLLFWTISTSVFFRRDSNMRASNFFIKTSSRSCFNSLFVVRSCCNSIGTTGCIDW